MDHFLRTLNSAFGTHVKNLTDDVMELFRSYHWPGNIRELEHLLEGALNMVGFDEVLSMKYFASVFDGVNDFEPIAYPDPTPGASPSPVKITSDVLPGEKSRRTGTSLTDRQAEQERAAVVAALSETGGNVSRSADILGISRQLLHYKMRKHMIKRDHFKNGRLS